LDGIVTARLSPPRYQRIAQSLRERIAAGEFGDELPSLDSLRSDYAVGRHTVGRALAILVKDGVVKRVTGHTYRTIPWGETRTDDDH
jgi:DNA-binding GntR family transcriptional regulator